MGGWDMSDLGLGFDLVGGGRAYGWGGVEGMEGGVVESEHGSLIALPAGRCDGDVNSKNVHVESDKSAGSRAFGNDRVGHMTYFMDSFIRNISYISKDISTLRVEIVPPEYTLETTNMGL